MSSSSHRDNKSVFVKMPGTRLQVWRGSKTKTSGGLRKADLKKNKRGKIVSKKVSAKQTSKSNLGVDLRSKTGTKRKLKSKKKPNVVFIHRYK